MALAPEFGSVISTASLLLALLVVLYLVGVWIRSYVMPPATGVPLAKELLVGVPLGTVVMSMYARSAFPALENTAEAVPVYEYAYTLGYAVVMGMISRETLDRLIANPPRLPERLRLPRRQRP